MRKGLCSNCDILDMEETKAMDVLDEKLEGILEKHHIYHFPSKAEMISQINRIFSEIDKEKTVSIRGALLEAI